MTAAARTTRPTITMPKTADDVSALLDRLSVVKATLAQHDAQRDDDIAQIRLFHANAAGPLMAEAENLAHQVQMYCEMHRAEITNGGVSKTVAWPSGTVGWRKTPPAVTIEDTSRTLDELLRRDLKQYVRTTLAINKQAILASPALALSVAGVAITPGDEEFFIKTKG